MTSIEKKIYNLKPRYLTRFEGLLRRFAQFGGGASNDKYVQGRYFSNVYEFYMFAFFIGLYNDASLELLEEDSLKGFWEIENWKPRDMVDHLLACALARSDFDMVKVQELEEEGVSAEVRKLRYTIESYANGGLRLISRQVEEDPELAETDEFLLRLISEENGF